MFSQRALDACAQIPLSHTHIYLMAHSNSTLHTNIRLFDLISTCFSFPVFFFHLFHFSNFVMEFKYRDGQIRRTPSPLRSPLPSNSYVSNRPLHGNTFLIFMFLSSIYPFVFLFKYKTFVTNSFSLNRVKCIFSHPYNLNLHFWSHHF